MCISTQVRERTTMRRSPVQRMVLEVHDTNSMHLRCVGVYAEDVALRRAADMNRALPADTGGGPRFSVSDALPLVCVGGFELTVNDGRAHLYPPPHARVVIHANS